MDVTESPSLQNHHLHEQQQPPHRIPSKTTQYHAQLYSEQKRLQRQLLQQTSSLPSASPITTTVQNAKRKEDATNQSSHNSHVRITLPTLSFETPNLYRTSLKLAKEINIHHWWATVVDLFTSNSFHASRVTLCVPQDASDPFNGPWGLKAVYDSPTTSIIKCFELLQPLDSDPVPLINHASIQQILRRNELVVLSREYRPPSSIPFSQQRRMLKKSLDDEDMVKRALLVTSKNSLDSSSDTHNNNSNSNIGGSGTNNNESYGNTIENNENESKDLNLVSSMKIQVAPSLPSLVSDYDEYEQQQPSPWSHSPAPSPALMDPDVNPFFQSPPDIDDDAFNPDTSESSSCHNVSVSFPPPASNTHSLVHIPIVHPPDIDDKNNNNNNSGNDKNKSYATPIAILSFLSPVVPYPAVLLHCLRSLQMFIATSLSNALAYSRLVQKSFNMENDAASNAAPTGRKPLLRRHSHKIKRWPSQTFSLSSTSSYSSSSSSFSSTTLRKSKVSDDDKDTHTVDACTSQLKKSISAADFSSGLDSPNANTDDTASPIMGNELHSLDQHSLESRRQAFASIDDDNVDNNNNNNDNRREDSTLPSTPEEQQQQQNRRHLSEAKKKKKKKNTARPVSLSTSSSSSSSSNSSSSIMHPLPLERPHRNQPPARKRSSVMECRRQHSYRNRHGPTVARVMRSPRRLSSTSASSLAEENEKQHSMRRIKSRERLDKHYISPRSSLLQLVIDGIPIHVFTCSTSTGQITWVNNRILQYTGRPLHSHLGPGWLSHMHPDDQTDCRQAWEKAFEQGNGFAGEYRLRRFDGVYRSFLWRIVPLRDIKGKIIHWFGTCTDVHDQQLAKESNLRQMEIESNERKYRLLAEAIPQIVFTFSPGVGLTYANGKWESYSAQPFERTKGLGFMSQVHPDDRHKLQLPDLSPPNTAGIAWHTEIRLLGGDGCYRWFLVKCISVDELDTGEVRWFGTCTDINDHKLLEHKLKEAHNAAQRSTESKTRFLSNMSHEIRTPLIGITGMLNFLLDTELTAEQLDYAHTIQQSAESLLVVINDILDLSKVEAGMMKLEWEPFSLVTMIEDANELLSTLAIQKGLELSFYVDDDVPAVVLGDRVRLRQVLLNLIGNAIKFTTYGEVYTRCTVQKGADTKETELMLLFEVIDTGTGFDSDGEAVMFKPFSQVDSSSTRKHGGSGLGLVISRQLIELHGGEMKCAGKKGYGSTFSFTAKFEIPKPNTRPLPQTPQNENADPFFRTEAYKVVHDQAYRQEMIEQQQKQQKEQQITEQQKQQQAPPLSHEKTTVNHHPPLPSVDNSINLTAFSPSPLAHSKKHSQAEGIPLSSTEEFQDVLTSKPVKMQLKPPPRRKQPLRNPVSSSLSTSSSTTTTTTTTTTAFFSASSSPTTENTQPLSTPIVPSPIITLHEPPVSATATPPITAFNTPVLSRTFSTTAASTPDLISTNTAVILPPRTPTQAAPLRTLIVCEWEHSRDTMERHIRKIVSGLGSENHHPALVLDIAKNASEAHAYLADPSSGNYDYILINLRSEQHILGLAYSICEIPAHSDANVLIVTTPMQRSLIMEYASSEHDGHKNVIPKSCGFVFKPLKRSKLNWYFGIRNNSNGSNNNSNSGIGNHMSRHGDYLNTEKGFYSSPDASHRSASTQKEVFRKMEADVGGKGFRILLVEDNMVNQKVLTRYLVRVGLSVDVANDGEECVKLFMEKPYGYYSLILCDLFMPVKDGYEATREIREWEENHLQVNVRRIPIVALSANVMSNVATKCLEAGFSTYISKPVNFAILSDVIRSYLLPESHLHLG